MRSRTILLVHCLVALPALSMAQHSHHFEFGAFGSFTRYDKAFALDNQIGGGGRIGYFFNPVVGFEFDVGYQQPSPVSGAGPTTLSLGGARFEFREQTHVLDRDHRLIGEGLQQGDLLFGKRSGFGATDGDGTHRAPVAHQRHGQDASETCGACVGHESWSSRRILTVLEDVRDRDDAARENRPSGSRVAAGRSREELVHAIDICRIHVHERHQMDQFAIEREDIR